MNHRIKAAGKFCFVFYAAGIGSLVGFAKSPDCSKVDGWATSMAFTYLKDAGLTNNDKVDFTRTKTTLMASEKIGKDLYRQVHFIVFTEKSNKTIQLIAINNASSEECSMSGVDVFVVSQRIGEPTKFER